MFKFILKWKEIKMKKRNKCTFRKILVNKYSSFYRKKIETKKVAKKNVYKINEKKKK